MASVYTNDLRLEEIGSGEQSGTWGDTTNTNLELIAEAFSFGTEAITTNADTHTTTIADGATDAGRSMFLKYTGTLDSACTITIGPNTVSKLWFIENGTSGSQNIIISQGSGANITIPAGQTKAIYSNGAGSGAAMVDAFATLNVVDLLVDDDLTVTDDVAIGGLATIGETLAVTGVLTTTAATVFNGGFAANAASTITTADNLPQLTLISTDADANKGPVLDLFRNSANPAVNDVMGQIKFVGEDDGGNQVNYARINTEVESPANGNEIGRFNIITLDNLGGSAAEHERLTVTGTESVFNEDGANIDFRVESDANVNMLFVDAGGEVVTIGGLAGSTSEDSGYFPLQVGNTAAAGTILQMLVASDGFNTIHFGDGVSGTARYRGYLQYGMTDEIMNFGASASTQMQLSSAALFISAGTDIRTATSGTSNFRAGVNAGNSIVSGGNYNTVIGDEAGTAVSTGDNNTLVGYSAGTAVNTSVNNVAVGTDSMLTNTTGDNNVALGREALKRLTTSNENVAVGSESLKETTTGTKNTAVGHTAGQYALTAASSTFVGHSAGKGITGAKLTGNNHTALGSTAGLLLQGAAIGNTLLGNGAGDNITTGSYNVMVGFTSRVSAANITSEIVVGSGTAQVGKGGNTGFISPNSGAVYQGNNASTWSTTSDQRLKKNIVDSSIGLDEINKLKVRNFQYKTKDDIDEIISDGLKETDIIPAEGVQVGVVAQEIKEIFPKCVKEETTGVLSVNPDNLTWHLIKAVQELSTALDAALARIAVLEG